MGLRTGVSRPYGGIPKCTGCCTHPLWEKGKPRAGCGAHPPGHREEERGQVGSSKGVPRKPTRCGACSPVPGRLPGSSGFPGTRFKVACPPPPGKPPFHCFPPDSRRGGARAPNPRGYRGGHRGRGSSRGNGEVQYLVVAHRGRGLESAVRIRRGGGKERTCTVAGHPAGWVGRAPVAPGRTGPCSASS